MAGALSVMNGGRPGTQRDPISCKLQAFTKINIFVIQKIIFIKTVHCFEYIPMKQHEHPGHPVGIDDLISNQIVGVNFFAEKFFCNQEKSWKFSGAVGDFKPGIQNEGGDDTDFRIIENIQQDWEWVFPQPNVGIDDAEVLGAARFKCRVVVVTEPFGLPVPDRADLEGHRHWIERQFFGQVKRKRDLNTGSAAVLEVTEKGFNQMALTVTDDGKRDSRAGIGLMGHGFSENRRALREEYQARAALQSAIPK